MRWTPATSHWPLMAVRIFWLPPATRRLQNCHSGLALGRPSPVHAGVPVDHPPEEPTCSGCETKLAAERLANPLPRLGHLPTPTTPTGLPIARRIIWPLACWAALGVGEMASFVVRIKVWCSRSCCRFAVHAVASRAAAPPKLIVYIRRSWRLRRRDSVSMTAPPNPPPSRRKTGLPLILAPRTTTMQPGVIHNAAHQERQNPFIPNGVQHSRRISWQTTLVAATRQA
jgi:hypothetical protein